ncbi:MAG: translation initiation factor IF-3 [Elusimicrobiota bacterium]
MPRFIGVREEAVDKKLRSNFQIRIPQVRLIDVDGTQLGIKPTSEAVQLAQSKGFDLVEISPTATPPVCKIIDYSKFRYEQEKRSRDARKKQKGGHLKEIRVSPRIGAHDLEIKLNHAKEFLSENNKVQVSVVFRGRENRHKDLGWALAERIKIALNDAGEMEGRPSTFGNRLIMMLIPKKAGK